MGAENVMHYVLMYILPSIFLYILGTYILVRSYPYKTAKLVAASIFCSAIGYTVDFIRVLLPIEFNNFLQHYVVLFAVNLSLAFMMHVIYDLVKTMKPIKMPFMPYILYSFPVLILGVKLAENSVFETLLSKEGSSEIMLSIVYIAMFVVTLILLYIGYQCSKIKEYRLFFKVCLSFLAIAFTSFALWKLDWIQLTYVLPVTSELFLTTLTGMLISYLFVKTSIVPSTVKRYSALFESSATPIVILDINKQVLEVNESGKLDYHMRVNMDFRNYFNYTNEPALIDQMFTLLDDQSYIKGYRITYLDAEGIENIVLVDASKVNLVNETYYYCMIHEVTLEFQRRSLNEHLAYHDVLTGIYNRTYFEAEVKRKLAQDGKKDSALIICDLNFFKAINDTYGHQTGDNVLVFTANCLRENLPKPHILARLGGDEFVMFFEETKSKQQFLQQITEARCAFQLNLYKQDEIEIEIVPSLGIAFVDEDGTDYEHLYHVCDVRMYEDKKIMKEQYLQRQG